MHQPGGYRGAQLAGPVDEGYLPARVLCCVVIWLGGPVEVDGKDLWPIPPLLEAAQKNLKRTELPIRHGTKDWIRHVLRPDYTTNGDLMDKRWNAIIKSLILLLQKP
ncbi:hypothetical protein ACEPPN_018647 [Leptodophora sp. 'Broadleaf-Isolate-01']